MSAINVTNLKSAELINLFEDMNKYLLRKKRIRNQYNHNYIKTYYKEIKLEMERREIYPKFTEIKSQEKRTELQIPSFIQDKMCTTCRHIIKIEKEKIREFERKKIEDKEKLKIRVDDFKQDIYTELHEIYFPDLKTNDDDKVIEKVNPGDFFII